MFKVKKCAYCRRFHRPIQGNNGNCERCQHNLDLGVPWCDLCQDWGNFTSNSCLTACVAAVVSALTGFPLALIAHSAIECAVACAQSVHHAVTPVVEFERLIRPRG